MANVLIDAGENPTIPVAIETVGSDDYQLIKLIDPTAASTDPIGNSANPMHVQGSVTASNVPQLVTTKAINSIGFDLQGAAFSSSSSVTNDYILDTIEFNFSTTESKTITVTTSDGTKIYEDTNTNQSVILTEIDQGFDANQNFTIDITQFSSPGTCDVVAIIREGGTTLGGNPTVTQASVDDTYVISEDTNFVSGDSPVSYDVNAALGRNGTQFTVWNDGPGDFTIAVSNDGATFSGEHTMKNGESFGFDNIEVDTIRITHVSDSSYRIVAL